MKKIYSLICAFAFSSLGIAQTQINNFMPSAVIHDSKVISFDKKKFSKNKNQVLRTTGSGSSWFCSAIAFDNLLSNTSSFASYPFFPDTMGKFTFSNGNFSTFVHALGDVLDPKCIAFLASPTTDFINNPAPQAYSVDSVSIVYAYDRQHPNTNVVDTLIITIANNNIATNLGGGYYASSTATFITNYNTDTLQLHRPKYVYTTQSLNATGSVRVKVPLTIDDTASTSFNEKLIALPSVFNVPAGKVLICSVVFKPGYSYVEGDVISNVGNSFYFGSYEENGTNTYQSYYDCNLNGPDCDFTNSSIVNSQVRYNNAGSFNGSFLPSYLFSQAYRFEHHLISYKISSSVATGIKETVSRFVELGQNIPNPFTKESTINYTLAKDASSVVFTVTDVMGRVITSEKVNANTGNHSIKVGSYAAGVYYYSLNVDGVVSTRKMIVE